MKRANGDGTVVKMTGNRRRPWACRKVIGWKEDGRPILKYISYHKTKREAEIALNRYNEDPYDVSGMTLADLFNEWVKIQEKGKQAGTVRGYRARYEHLRPLYDEKITDINMLMLEKVYNDLNVSKNTLWRTHNLISMLLKYAVKRHYLPVSALNITKGVNLPDKEDRHFKPREILNNKEIDMLWSIQHDNEYAKIILVYLYTGLRYSELKNLEASDCHDNYIEIKQAKTAAGVRIVPICDKLKQVLPIVPLPSYATFERRFKELLPDHTIHDTRHTFVSMLTEKGVDVRVIKAIVGHKVSDITALYTHISLDVMLEAVNRL